MTEQEVLRMLRERLQLEQMVAKVSQVLLTEPSYQAALEETCRIMGETMAVSRVYVFENFKSNTHCCNTVEWAAPGISPVKNDLQDVPYDAIPYWKITLEKNETVRADDIHSLPADVVDILEWQDIRSILVVPLFVFDHWAGFLGFDICGQSRAWSDDDVAIIQTAGRLIASLMEKRELEHRLAHSGRLSAVGSLAAGVAHEYNNLHAGIMGLIELTLEDNDLSDRTRKDLERVLQLIERGVNLTRRLLSVSRQSRDVSSVDVKKLVEDCLVLLGKQFMSELVTVDFSCPATETHVEGNASELNQIVLNLLLNSAEALWHSEKKSISVELRNAPGARLVLELEDSGPGLPQNMLTAIFEPFVTTKGKLGGGDKESTGLGLTIAQRVAVQHGGSLSGRNAPHGGAVFTLELPLKEGPQAKPPDSAPALYVIEHRGRLGILDDEANILSILGRFFRAEGHHVECFEAAEPAILAMNDRHFDLFLVDLVLPAEGGLSFLEAASAVEAPSQPRLLVMSGKAEADFRGQHPEYAHLPFIGKPFGALQSLGKEVQELLGRET